MELSSSKARLVMRTLIALACSSLLALSLAGVAWAAPNAETVENAGNVFATSEDNTSEAAQGKVVRDLYWAGRDLDISSYEVGGDAITAGMNMTIANSDVNGSVRMAGKDISLTNVKAKNNFTLAGKDIKMNSCDAEGGVYVAGSDISFSGNATGAAFAGSNVVIDGTIDGDVTVMGASVEIGPNAVITGNLKVSAAAEPVIAEGAKVESLEFEKVETEEKSETAVNAAAAFAGLALAITVITKIIGLLGTILFAIVLAWLFRRPVEHASAMTRKQAGRIFGTGAIAAVAAPIAFFLLLGFVVTLPIAFALLAALITLTIVSTPFAAAAFARLVFPKMNRIGAAAIGGAVLGIATIIPFLGGLVGIASFIYIVGYVIQALWQQRHADSVPEGVIEAEEVIVTADAENEA